MWVVCVIWQKELKRKRKREREITAAVSLEMGCEMIVKINVKQLGKRKDVVNEVPFNYENVPETVEQLIIATVRICVTAYTKRLEENDTMHMLDEKTINDMAGAGKIAFGISYGEKEPDEKVAIDTAIIAFEDGLYRIFLGEEELTDLGQKIQLVEGDSLTFVRLTMLAGRLW